VSSLIAAPALSALTLASSAARSVAAAASADASLAFAAFCAVSSWIPLAVLEQAPNSEAASRAAGKPSDVIRIFILSSVVQEADTTAYLPLQGAKGWPDGYFFLFLARRAEEPAGLARLAEEPELRSGESASRRSAEDLAPEGSSDLDLISKSED